MAETHEQAVSRERQVLEGTEQMPVGVVVAELLTPEYWSTWLRNNSSWLDEGNTYGRLRIERPEAMEPSLVWAADFMANFAKGVYDRIVSYQQQDPAIKMPTLSMLRPLPEHEVFMRSNFTLLDGSGIVVPAEKLYKIARVPPNLKSPVHLEAYTSRQYGVLNGREEGGHSAFFQSHPGWTPYEDPFRYVPYLAQDHEFIELADRLQYVQEHLEEPDEELLRRLQQDFDYAKAYREGGFLQFSEISGVRF